MIEPVANAPAATATASGERLLIVADYHAGIEQGLRHEGVELADGAPMRRQRLQGLIAETKPDRLVILGDLMQTIGSPTRPERRELAALFGAISIPTTLVKGNHDGDIEPILTDIAEQQGLEITVTDAGGIRMGTVGFTHGHTWPSPDVLGATVVCIGHEHPVVRLTDEVGGTRIERVWLRGPLAAEPFIAEGIIEPVESVDASLVVFPAFNNRSGGTWVNRPDQSFLSPFLPAALPDGEAYLPDGTRLGPYRDI